MISSSGEFSKDRASSLLKQMQNVIDGNNCRASDLTAKDWEESDATITLELTWHYQYELIKKKENGRHNRGQNFGKNYTRFKREIARQESKAETDRSIREFLLVTMGSERSGDALTLASESQMLFDFGETSYYDGCSNCRSSGKVKCSYCSGNGRRSCSSCSGSGRVYQPRSVNDGRGGTRTEQYSVGCVNCGGSGWSSCHNCSGSGSNRCNSCAGTGYFTHTYHGKAMAIPTFKADVIAVEHEKEALYAFIMREPLSLLGSLLPFEITPLNERENERIDQFYCKGSSSIITLECTLKDRQYSCGALGSIPYVFNQPPFFDQLFERKLNQLSAIYQDGERRYFRLSQA